MNRTFVPPTTLACSYKVTHLFEALTEKARADCFRSDPPHVSKVAEVLNLEDQLCVLAAVHLGLQRIWIIQE